MVPENKQRNLKNQLDGSGRKTMIVHFLWGVKWQYQLLGWEYFANFESTQKLRRTFERMQLKIGTKAEKHEMSKRKLK